MFYLKHKIMIRMCFMQTLNANTGLLATKFKTPNTIIWLDDLNDH